MAIRGIHRSGRATDQTAQRLPKAISLDWRPCGQVEKNRRRWQLRDHGSTCQQQKNRAPDRATKTLRLASAFAERFDCSGAEFIGSSQLQRGMRDRMADVIRLGVTDC
ncbi:hypothetical protein DPX16_19554 [Anabarilius grahami]|uniref:Uncharacterized protein n=1 Tax=Anabarilius grahami TaxID=495550 RepID=A0A3N0YPV0_ANAGA|nr:hypothetical protein DPX16_19554 [Anabarilius grahami]